MGSLFHLAWRVIRYIPRPVAAAGFAIGADIAWLRQGKSIERYEANLRRVRPELDERSLRRLSRKGMRSYLRYYCELFQLGNLTQDQIRARSNMSGIEPILKDLADDRSIIIFLGHSGNWDLAGAIVTKEIAPLTTVAERLKPEQLYQEFLSFRTRLGIDIIPLEIGATGGGVFRELVRVAKRPGQIVALLADRDLTSRGVEVRFLGETARMAAGPAALAIATKAALFPVYIRYERLTGKQRRNAGGPWGIRFEFGPRLDVSDGVAKADAVGDLTQQAASFLEERIREHPEDWHMMQRVFIADLDPERDAEIHATEASQNSPSHKTDQTDSPEGT